MRGRDLLEDMEFLEDDLIENAGHFRIHKEGSNQDIKDCIKRRSLRKKVYWFRWVSFAAVILCILSVGLVNWILRPTTTGEHYEENGINQSYGADTNLQKGSGGDKLEEKQEQAEGCYPIPKKGQYFCVDSLKELMDIYENRTKVFYIRISLFGDYIGTDGSWNYGEITSEMNDILRQEYGRLLEKGYDVTLTEGRISGYFTGKEIEEFQAEEQFGYVFSYIE